ncbi:MAG: hypothetical protein H6582_04520 [Crocinitomicaceae bacterium]|nr:hypothetical protein [Crocinitomicaceae bacterium]
MKTRSILFGLLAVSTLTVQSCKKKGCTDETATNYSSEAEKDDGSCEYLQEAGITLYFTQNVNGSNITVSNFDQLNYTNADGNVWSITKMQYLISDVRFYKANGDSLVIDGYHLIDMEDASSLYYTLPSNVPTNPYVGIGFNFGFDATDNISGQYSDLNSASWASPEMLGGGYHQMKFEGRFIKQAGDTSTFQYHSLSEIREITQTDTIFHHNYVHLAFTQSFNFTADDTIQVKMNVNNWFANPHTWDLDTLSSMLMPNYAAQVMMTDNIVDVFSIQY